MTTRYRATVSYDGTAYVGFQRQKNGQSIQGELEAAIQAVTSQEAVVIGAGRTDAGVHARGQVISFDVAWRHTDETLLKAINANLPDDIALQDIAQQPGFHPRFDAIRRRYRYTVIEAQCPQPLMRHRAWRIPDPLDLAAMQTFADALIGQHDFASFGHPPQGSNTVRTVYTSRWTKSPESYGALLVYEIEANAFLRHMVRRIAGMLVDVGRRRTTVEGALNAFNSRDISQAKTLAPSCGLILEAVRYNE